METAPQEDPDAPSETTAWAYISHDPDGSTGIIAADTPIGTLPLITTNPAHVPRIRDYAHTYHQLTGRPVSLAIYHRVHLTTAYGRP
jgi:hypothetical protein